MIAPVSGSKKTKIDGINVIINNLRISKNSFLIDRIFVSFVRLTRYKTSVNLTISLGWKVNPKILNQHLAPFVFFPKNKTSTNKMQEAK